MTVFERRAGFLHRVEDGHVQSNMQLRRLANVAFVIQRARLDCYGELFSESKAKRRRFLARFILAKRR